MIGVIRSFEQTAALRAIVENLSDIEPGAAGAVEAHEMSWHVLFRCA
jgi:hypothetical protein